MNTSKFSQNNEPRLNNLNLNAEPTISDNINSVEAQEARLDIILGKANIDFEN